MDLCAIQVRCGNPPRFHFDPLITENSGSCKTPKTASFDAGRSRRGLRWCGKNLSSCYCRGDSSFVVRAMGKRNHENNNNNDDNSSSSSSSSSGNDDRPIPNRDGSKERNTPEGKDHHNTLDWREFRATLFAREQAETAEPVSHEHGGVELDSKSLGLKWAHPISLPEPGSVLVATEKLDKSRTFERTVILLVGNGTKNPYDGPRGVVLNRPFHRKVKHTKPDHLDLSAAFADNSLHFGGPLNASTFLLRTSENRKFSGCKEVIPGLCFGARSSLEEVMVLVNKGVLKPQDFRFFIGYAGWGRDQLKQELEHNLWHVAACSMKLLFDGNMETSECLWEEILQLMGGQYSELSRRPKLDI